MSIGGAGGGASQNGGRSYSFKMVLLGEGCVGKTSLILRYVENKFNDRHHTTQQVRNQTNTCVNVHNNFFYLIDIAMKD